MSSSSYGNTYSYGTAYSREPGVENVSLPTWTHRDVLYWHRDWVLIRDACAGERAVKDQGRLYLPQLEGMDKQEYDAYLDRATFFSFTGRTAAAMSGAIFRREHITENFPEELLPKLENFTRSKMSFRTFAMYCADELVKVGRVGILLDLPAQASTEPRPYVTSYVAENIIDWEYGEIDGRLELVRVVLREERKVEKFVGTTQQTLILPQYRQLILRDGVYRQEVYFTAEPDPLKPLFLAEQFREQVIVPTHRGNTFDRLPFFFVRMPDKPPMLDIARLNMSHYRSYAHLEHGRLFTGFPIYYVEAPQGGGETEAEFELGASKVWVTPPGAKPGLLELNGQGLKFLVEALDIKEQQASTLGGRLMGIRPAATAESNNIVKISERNEQCLLLKLTLVMDEHFTALMRWWAQLYDVPKARAEKLLIEFNKDFLFDNGGAREFRAIQSMYKDGLIPIEVVYGYLRKNEVVPDWMQLAEFKRLLESASSFPGDQNFEARQEGFADAKSRDQARLKEMQIESDETIAEELQDATTERLEMTHEHDTEKADKAAERGEKMAAKIAAGGGPPPPGQPPRPGAPAPGQPPGNRPLPPGQVPPKKPPPPKA